MATATAASSSSRRTGSSSWNMPAGRSDEELRCANDLHRAMAKKRGSEQIRAPSSRTDPQNDPAASRAPDHVYAASGECGRCPAAPADRTEGPTQQTPPARPGARCWLGPCPSRSLPCRSRWWRHSSAAAAPSARSLAQLALRVAGLWAPRAEGQSRESAVRPRLLARLAREVADGFTGARGTADGGSCAGHDSPAVSTRSVTDVP
jgi:hypothetical protein